MAASLTYLQQYKQHLIPGRSIHDLLYVVSFSLVRPDSDFLGKNVTAVNRACKT